MAIAKHPGHFERLRRTMGVAVLSVCLMLLGSVPVHALTDMPDSEMDDVSGTGIAIALDDFQFAMAPTSYMEQVGSAPSPNCTGSGSVASNINCWRRGDLRWFGLALSGITGNGYQWDDVTTCTASQLNCPRGGIIDEFSPFDNPYVLRAWSPQGMHYDGGCVNGDDGAGGCNAGISNTTKAIYEYVAPTLQPTYKMTFWGELEAGATRNTFSDGLSIGQGFLLKNQAIIQGNAAGSVFRLFQFTDPANETFALYYHSYLRGAWRFSVNRSLTSDTAGVANNFSNDEGMHFNEVSAFLPLGQLYYQALILNSVGTSGSFYLELTKIPNNATVYTKFYGINTVGAVRELGVSDARGYDTARCSIYGMDPQNTCGAIFAGNNEPYRNANYNISHGYSRWGGNANVAGIGAGNGMWFPRDAVNAPAGYRNARNDATDGIFFRKCTGCADIVAFAKRAVVIDKRGPGNSQHRTHYYNCSTLSVCGADGTPSGYTTLTATGATVYANDTVANQARTYVSPVINLGDSRIEGLLVNFMRMTSCQGGNCP